MAPTNQQINLGGRAYQALRNLGGGLFHDSYLIDDEGTKLVLKLFKSSYAQEFEAQVKRWREGALVGGSDLVGYLETGTLASPNRGDPE